MTNKQTRINVNINRQTDHALRGYAAMHQVSVTEALRVQVGIAALVLQDLEDGAEIFIKRRNDKRPQRVTFHG